MLEIACAAAGNYRHGQCLAHGASQLQVIATAMTIGIPTGEQYLARPQRYSFLSPLQSIDTGGLAPSVGTDLPLRISAAIRSLCVYGYDYALGAEPLCTLGNEPGIEHSRSIDGSLVGTSLQHGSHIARAAQASTYGARDKDLLSYMLNHSHHSFPSLTGSA